MVEGMANLIPDMGAGGIIGFILGYAAKLIFKIAIAFIGIYLGSLVYLQQRQIITINEAALKSTVESTIPNASNLAQTIISISPFGGAFAAGFYIGFKKM